MISLLDTDSVNTSSVADLENQVSQMEKALSLGSLEPNLAGEMINQVSRLLHSPPASLAPLAQRYDLENWRGTKREPSTAKDVAYIVTRTKVGQ
jgi:hypothetical protein